MTALTKAFGGVLSLALAVAFGGMPAAAATKLTVYSSYSLDDLPLIEEAFERAHPEIELVFNRDSEGVIVARVLAERNNRRPTS